MWLLQDECDLHPLTDASAYLAAIAAYGAAHPDRAWITGSGWAMPAFAGGNPHGKCSTRSSPIGLYFCGAAMGIPRG